MNRPGEVTGLLLEASSGNRTALDSLMQVVYDELRGVAHRQLSLERPDHTLQTTALVHEVFLKLIELDRIEWSNRAQFFAICARLMRRILVDYARRRATHKRGGDAVRIELGRVPDSAGAAEHFDATLADDLLALDNALVALEAMDERQARIVENRFFAGMSVAETAEALGISPATVKRDWSMARAWLNGALATKG